MASWSPFNSAQNRKQELQGGSYAIIAMIDNSHHLPNSHMYLLQGLFSISHELHFYISYASQQHKVSTIVESRLFLFYFFRSCLNKETEAQKALSMVTQLVCV